MIHQQNHAHTWKAIQHNIRLRVSRTNQTHKRPTVFWNWWPTNRIQKNLWGRYYQHSHKITNKTSWPGPYTNITSQRHLEIDCTITPGNYHQINHIWSIPTGFQESTSKSTHQENNFGSFTQEELSSSLQSFFWIKTYGWVVADQWDTYNLMNPNPSAYRTKHYTDTTLLKVKSDILSLMDKQEILLGSSAAWHSLFSLLINCSKRKLFI